MSDFIFNSEGCMKPEIIIVVNEATPDSFRTESANSNEEKPRLYIAVSSDDLISLLTRSMLVKRQETGIVLRNISGIVKS